MLLLAWGSRSMSSVRRPRMASAAARLTAVVVFPTPPFWLAMATIIVPDCEVPAHSTRSLRVTHERSGAAVVVTSRGIATGPSVCRPADICETGLVRARSERPGRPSTERQLVGRPTIPTSGTCRTLEVQALEPLREPPVVVPLGARCRRLGASTTASRRGWAPSPKRQRDGVAGPRVHGDRLPFHRQADGREEGRVRRSRDDHAIDHAPQVHDQVPQQVVGHRPLRRDVLDLVRDGVGLEHATQIDRTRSPSRSFRSRSADW